MSDSNIDLVRADELPIIQYTPTTPAQRAAARPDEADQLLVIYRRYVLAADFGICLLAGIGATVVRFKHPLPFGFWFAIGLYPVLWVVMLALTRSYETRFLASASQETERVARAGLLFFALVAVVSYSLHVNASRFIVLVVLAITVAGSLATRVALRTRLYRRRKRGEGMHRTLIVGPADAAHHLITRLKGGGDFSLDPVGVCVPADQSPFPDEVDDVPVLGTMGSILHAVDEARINTVAIVSHPDLSGHGLRRLSWALEERGVDLLVSPGIVEVAGPRISIRAIAGLSLLHLRRPEVRGLQMLLKTCFDRAVAVTVLVLAAPVLFGLAVAIRMDTPGPAFNRQRRIGVNGKPFLLLKFRYIEFATDNAQLTRVGSWMRRWSLDSLPQVLNVLRGDLSLVGPRPPSAEAVAAYDAEALQRLRVRPGMTGLWQISERPDMSWEDKLRLDLRYVETWTLGMDLAILYRTLNGVRRRSRAGV